MKRIFMSLATLVMCILMMNPVSTKEFQESDDSQNTLRILKLLPNLSIPLAVEPGIPTDFVALSPKGTLDPYDWIYWGPRDVLKAYFENPKSLQVPILRVKLSANVSQIGPDPFTGEKFLEPMKQKDPKNFASIDTKWGDYPVLAVRTKINGPLIFMAWVGLNDPSAGWTLLFNLVYPEKKGHPNMEDRQLWESLIVNTTPLKDEDYFKACGQDMQDGYTLVNVNGAKLKMIAEKRLSDGLLQVVVIPQSPKVEFNYIDMMECQMGAKWRYGEPLVKIYGEIMVKNDNFKSVTAQVTSIFFKTVQEFSLKKEEEKNLLIFQKRAQ